MMAAEDRRHMARALVLAERGLWTSDPNPRVGCVLADGERVIAEGWHERAGGPHAEAMALATAGGPVKGATAYVTLEPCCHHGRTPPCADALIAAGIRRVHYALRDPNPRVSGGGVAMLEAVGIEVAGGLLADQARALNPGFHSRMERGRPWLRLVTAQHPDPQSLRARSSAVLTSAAMVRSRDLRLDVELPGASRQPMRVVLDAQLSLAPTARILAPPGRVLVLTESTDAARRGALERAGAEVEQVPTSPQGMDLQAMLRRLAELEVNELQVECDPALAGALLRDGLVDERAD
jgi:diaminohydroxyphosphoribosylaminopyrimidine deaminase/5-amino-6-(5-phosphoribosylamino)uracil reductase